MTTVAMEQLSPLARLQERVLRFPARHEEVKRIDNLRQIEQFVSGLVDEVEKIRSQRKHATLVFPHAEASASDRALQSVQAKASVLERVIATGPQSWEAEAQQAVRDLRRAVEAASAAVQREWAAEVGCVTGKYERLAKALHHTGLTDGTTIAGALERVRKLVTPPANPNAAERAAQDIASVARAITRLGASGVVGDFLVDALEGQGMALALRDAEVQRFLDDNQLWDMFRVVLALG